MPWEPYEDSRRLTGCNVYFAGSGAALESARGMPVDDGLLQCWRDGVALARSWLQWEAGAEVLRPHRSGVSLAFEAPIDQLYAATEANEWAWWRAVATAGITAPQGDAQFHAPGHAATWDDDTALHTLRAVAAAQALPALGALRAAARAHGVAFLPDDEVVSIGGGAGSIAWPIDALPVPADIDWSAVHDIPTALVTGSNGKTTTTRLLAAMCSAYGWRSAWSCTDGVFFEGTALETGDFSGPTGARTVLRKRQAQAAVLETARGGMLRRGLATCAANVAVVTNIAADHFGEYGIHDLDDLAGVKLVVAHAVTDGLLVLNGDDPVLLRKAAAITGAIGWFALAFDVALSRAGTSACGVRDGRLLLQSGGDIHDLGAIAAMPLTLDGRAQYNVGNIAAAALAATGLGIPPHTIAATLQRFGSARGDNPGRLQRWSFGTTEVVVDYAHNPDGLVGLLQAVGANARRGRLAIALGHAGNRSDDDLRLVAAAAAGFGPELSVLKDSGGYERGRAPGEVAAIMRGELQRLGVPDAAIVQELDEALAARVALQWAGKGDLIVLPIHSNEARDAVVAMLDAMQAAGWRAGDALPPAPAAVEDADILQRIVQRKRAEVAERVARTPLSRIAELAAQAPPARGFAAAIEATIGSGGVAVIAEVKKASPSRGVIRADYDPAAIARSYVDGGATCLSVLTDVDFFQGSDADLQRARGACTLPVLRKDFIIDAWQVYEARALGADCVLLIVAILDDGQLDDLAGLAGSLGMDVLIESHDLAELQRALQVNVVDGHAPLLGINNRDLRSFVVSLDTSLALRAHVPEGRRLVSESGIATAMDVARLRAAGIDALLVGEAFMREDDPGAALRSLVRLA